MEQVAWSIAVQASEWLRQALSAARRRDQQQFARLIEHAGTVVAAIRALDREAHRLFLPIIYGDLRTWPGDQRRRWAQDLVAFAYEDRITPALRVSLAALSELGPQQADRDVARLVEALLRLLNWSWRDPDLMEPVQLLNVSNITGFIDFRIGSELELLLAALDDPESANLERVRQLVSQFVYGDATRVQHTTQIRYSADQRDPYGGSVAKIWRPEALDMARDIEFTTEPASNLVTTLRPYADGAEGIFGQLLALQHRVFPELPTPVWVWQVE
jgi:hypothetical protein